MIDPAIFKAYDVRGIYGEQIDEEVAYRLGRGFARVLGELEDKRTHEHEHEAERRTRPEQSRRCEIRIIGAHQHDRVQVGIHA